MPKTRERVLAAVEKLGYEMSLRKQAALTPGNNSILVVTTTTLPALYNNIAKAAVSCGLQALFTLCQPGEAEPLLELLGRHNICGILWGCTCPPDSRLLEELARYPVVDISGIPNTFKNSYRVVTDERQMSFDATAYLISTGCRRIAMLSTASTIPENIRCQRQEGYMAAVTAAGITPWIVYGDYTYDGGYQGTKEIFTAPRESPVIDTDSPLPCDGIFCICDMMAIGCLNYLHAAGIHVPGEISVISLDNMEVTEFTNPPLTTIDAGGYDTAAEAVKLLSGIISGEYTRGRTIYINHELVVRKSTRQMPDAIM